MDFDEVLSKMLRTGVLVASTLVALGILLIMAADPSAPAKAPHSPLNSSSAKLVDVLKEAAAGSGHSYVYLGLIVLVSLPVATTLVEMARFIKERDALYAALTAITLFNLLLAMFVIPATA